MCILLGCFYFCYFDHHLQDGELVRTGNAVLKAEIVSADGSRAAETEITDNKNGTYEVGYALRSEGEYSFTLLLYGQPIRGSPFRLRAVKPSDVPQSPDDVKRRVKSPSGTGGHIRQKAVRRPSSMYSTTKKKENPIEDELIYRVGKTDDHLKCWYSMKHTKCKDALSLLLGTRNALLSQKINSSTIKQVFRFICFPPGRYCCPYM